MPHGQDTFLISDLIDQNGSILLTGSDDLKTNILAVDIILSILHGHPFHGEKTTRGGVLVFGMKRQLASELAEAWRVDRGLSELLPLSVFDRKFDLGDKGFILHVGQLDKTKRPPEDPLPTLLVVIVLQAKALANYHDSIHGL